MKTIKRLDNLKNKYTNRVLIQRLKKSLQRCKTEKCHIATVTNCMQCSAHRE